ncbi:MAG: metal-dependent hydrolase [Candidatus Edwardsbacteria bacterium]|nr:metal-dependent hydrolase [Candidatus Edwardsbacteria bacterium]
MTGKTHALAGANAAGWSLLLFPGLSHSPIWLAIGGLAGLLPDLDASESELQNVSWRVGGRRGIRVKIFKLPALIFHHLFGHRGALHSLLALLVFTALVTLLRAPAELVIAFGLGYLSHLLTDGLTMGGVPLFWPARGRVRLFPFIRIRTGGLLDQALFVGLSLALIAWVYLTQFNQTGAPPY